MSDGQPPDVGHAVAATARTRAGTEELAPGRDLHSTGRVQAGLAELVEYHAEGSEIVLPRQLSEGRQFDLAFVDGNHRFDGVFVDLVYLGRLVRPAGILFVDDYQLPAVARATSFFAKNLGWVLEELSPADSLHQWAVLRTAEVPDTRPFDFFVNF